jgi:biopolymer transport protein TolQ
MIETATALPADHSMWALFLQADPIVKGVMVLLLAASVACWTVIFDKAIRLAAARRAAQRFAQAVKSGGPVEGAETCEGLAREIVAHGVRAARDQDPSESRAERRNRVERAMRAAMIDQLKRLESGIRYSPRSARPRPSSACSALCGAS